jgi:hypothetical protein
VGGDVAGQNFADAEAVDEPDLLEVEEDEPAALLQHRLDQVVQGDVDDVGALDLALDVEDDDVFFFPLGDDHGSSLFLYQKGGAKSNSEKAGHFILGDNFDKRADKGSILSNDLYGQKGKLPLT